jgi:archaellum biogenesis protein FlaJ (TadC family)
LGEKDRLRDSLRKDGKQGKRGTWHSKAYHRFFEGYSEISVPHPNGKGTSIQRVYIGNYYRQNLTKSLRILLRMLYLVLFLCITYLYTSSAILPLMINSTWYVVLPQAASVVFLFWTLIAFFFYMPAEKDMKITDYRSSSLSLLKASEGSAICLGATALAVLIFVLISPSGESHNELLCAGKYLVAGLTALAIYLIEKKVSYLKIPNQIVPPDNSVEIN